MAAAPPKSSADRGASARGVRVPAFGSPVTRGVGMPGDATARPDPGDIYHANAFTGAVSLSLPIATTAARWLSPALSLDYSSAAGNGLYGIGFDVALGAISRRTSHGVPFYDDRDIFLFGDEILVPDSSGPAKRTVAGVAYSVQRFWRQVEDYSARVERWTPFAAPDAAFWRVIGADDVIQMFGSTAQARIADPADAGHVLSWLSEQQIDPRGEALQITYKREDTANISSAIYERNRCQTANLYPQRIAYGNVTPVGPQILPDLANAQWTYEVVFDYGEYDLSPGNDHPYTPVRSWAARPDPFSTYAAGFEQRTHRLCRNVMMFHRFPAVWGDEPALVRVTALRYEEDPVLCRLVGVTGIGWRYLPDMPSGKRYRIKPLPETRFAFSIFDPTDKGFVPIVQLDGGPLMALSAPQDTAIEDLFGAGAPGILYRDGASAQYWEPVRPQSPAAGGAPIRYAPAPAMDFPVAGRDPGSAFASLDGDGAVWLVTGDGSVAGATPVQSAPGPGFGVFAPFQGEALLQPEGLEFADLEGSGRTDAVVITPGFVTVYRSLGAEGYGSPLVEPAPDGLPVTGADESDKLVGFADLLGAGSVQRFRIAAGAVEVWPSLGRGRFGPRVTLSGAPNFGGGFPPSRLLLADINGTGAADLVFVGENVATLYLNQAGNSFARTPIVVPLPTSITTADELTTPDLFGTLCACLVVCGTLPEPSNWACDLAGGVKPYLLTQIDNALGTLTTFTYASSVEYALADKAAGRAWVTSLPFPVMVLARIEALDSVSGTRLTSSFAYHEGYFDKIEREFRGFGMVERTDVEVLLDAKGPTRLKGAIEGARADSDEAMSAPSLTREWFQLGSFELQPAIAAAYAIDYFGGDPEACPQLQPQFKLGAAPDTTTRRQAWTALAGEAIRSEVYGLDNGDPDAAPYSVTQDAQNVTLLQPADAAAGQPYAVFSVLGRETLDAVYDRVATDPRVSQSFALAYDAYGEVTRTCDVALARRKDKQDAIPEQAIQYVTCETADYLPARDESDLYLIGLVAEERSYQIANLAPPQVRGLYYSFADIAAQVETALAGGKGPTATLLDWTRATYLGDSGGASPPQAPAPQGLMLRVDQAVFSKAQVDGVFAGQPIPGGLDTFLVDSGGYAYEAANGYWWGFGSTTVYAGLAGFYQPVTLSDPFALAEGPRSGSIVTTTYDADWLIALQTSEAGRDGDVMTQVTRVDAIDYSGPRPRRIVVPNGGVSEAAFDPLGEAIATSYRGRQWDGKAPQPVGFTSIGDSDCYTWPEPPSLAALMAAPGDYLRGAADYNFSDLHALREARGPTSRTSLTASEYPAPAQPNTPVGPVRIAISYVDGFGRIAASKTLAEPGPAVACDADGAPSSEHHDGLATVMADTRWRCTGRVRYTNKGEPFKLYRPYFATSYLFPPDPSAFDGAGLPDTRWYDALGRTVRTAEPAGSMEIAFFSRVDYGAWSEDAYDQDDTIEQSPYYVYYVVDGHELPVWEKAALVKAAAFANTPTTLHFDALGHSVQTVRRLKPPGEDGDLITYEGFDVEGQSLWLADPRLYAKGVKNIAFTYGLAAEPLVAASADAGVSYALHDTLGNRIYAYDARGVVVTPLFDSLQRRTQIRVTQPGSATISVERLIYGDSLDAKGQPPLADPAGRNLIGQVAVGYDQSGRLETVAQSLDGNPLATERRLAVAYDRAPDWSAASALTWTELFAALDPQLASEVLTSSFSYDALGDVLSSADPGGDVTRSTYFVSGLCSGLWLTASGGPERPVMVDPTYTAAGERGSTSYANADGRTFMTSVRTYDPATLRLTGIVTTRLKDGTSLQDLAYYYDPAGNLTHVSDGGAPLQVAFARNQMVTPDQDLTYDALYRLTKSTGRALSGLTFPDYQSGGYECYFAARSANDPAAPQTYALNYCYDTSDNLYQTRFTSTASNWTSTLTIAETSNRGALVEKPSGLDPLAGYFDANGNLLRSAGVNPLTWTWNNQLAAATFVARAGGDPSDAEYYTYGRTCARLRKVSTYFAAATLRTVEDVDVGGFSRQRVMLNGTVQEETRRVRVADAGQALLERVSWTIGSPPPNTPNPQERYQLDNLIGSATLEVDGEGALISYEEYAPFGATVYAIGRSLAEVSLKRYRYGGRERDKRTGFYFYGARYYSPWTARWLSPDPAGAIDGPNVYAFLQDNPAASVDIGGLGKGSKPGKKGAKKGPKKNAAATKIAKTRFRKIFGLRTTTAKFYVKLRGIAAAKDMTASERASFIKMWRTDREFRSAMHEKVRVRAKKAKGAKRGSGLDEMFQTSKSVTFLERTAGDVSGVAKTSTFKDPVSGLGFTYDWLGLQQQMRLPTPLVLTKVGEGHSGALFTASTGQSGMTTGQAELHAARQKVIETSTTPEEAMLKVMGAHLSMTPNDATIVKAFNSGFDVFGNNLATAKGKEKFRDIQGVARNKLKDTVDYMAKGVSSATFVPPLSPRYKPKNPVHEVSEVGSSTSMTMLKHLPTLAGQKFNSFTL